MAKIDGHRTAFGLSREQPGTYSPMSAFEASTVYHGMVLLKARDGQIWRVWFEHGTHYPLMERLTITDWVSFSPALKELDVKPTGDK